jgi:patatin-like phospholipase/acyl hydrolase
MSTYRILSIDGGGIRGVLTARILERLLEDQPDLLQKVDLFAGTSTGGLLALGFAAGWSPAEARAFYVEKAHWFLPIISWMICETWVMQSGRNMLFRV